MDKARLIESSSCDHCELPRASKYFACHPHSVPSGSVQKHSTPASGTPFLLNWASLGVSALANWAHNSSKALSCEPFNGWIAFQSKLISFPWLRREKSLESCDFVSDEITPLAQTFAGIGLFESGTKLVAVGPKLTRKPTYRPCIQCNSRSQSVPNGRDLPLTTGCRRTGRIPT